MALVNTKKMFEMAYKNGYAIGAFSVNNMEISQGIIGAATEERTPLILQFSSGVRKCARPAYLRHLIDAALETTVQILRLLDGYIVCARNWGT